jgi:agmatine deiminase
MPAEWDAHDAIWLSWPHDPESFGEGLEGARRAYVELIRAIHKTERVELLVLDEKMRRGVSEALDAGGVDLSRLRLRVRPYADVWFRDYGPTFLTGGGKLAMTHWIFNAWGGKYEELKSDTEIPRDIEAELKLPTFRPGIVMEGGSIEVNGAGVLMTTEQCLLNKNRNPKLDRAAIERVLSDHLSVDRFLWLEEGIAGDDTDGHIDDIARFVNPDTIVCALEDDRSDANYAPLKACFEAIVAARVFNVEPLPMPSPVEDHGRRLPASYANFYIGNGVVLAPVFDCRQDDEALKVLERLFPGRRIAPVPCRDLVRGLGTIHCVSQQQPRP